MNPSLRRLINNRAEHCCEYCGYSWKRHFRWDGPRLVGRTPTGRATVRVLSINLPHRIRIRQRLIDAGLFPTP